MDLTRKHQGKTPPGWQAQQPFLLRRSSGSSAARWMQSLHEYAQLSLKDGDCGAAKPTPRVVNRLVLLEFEIRRDCGIEVADRAAEAQDNFIGLPDERQFGSLELFFHFVSPPLCFCSDKLACLCRPDLRAMWRALPPIAQPQFEQDDLLQLRLGVEPV